MFSFSPELDPPEPPPASVPAGNGLPPTEITDAEASEEDPSAFADVSEIET